MSVLTKARQLLLGSLRYCASTVFLFGPAIVAIAGDTKLTVETPMSPPAWALLERQLLEQNAVACREYFEKYFDERGWLLCVERWGGDDGPDDAIENCLDWPILHALGASDDVLQMYKRAWEGHLRQYTLAKTVDVPFARDGMYYKEFPVMMDWLHNAEGLVVFNLQGLSDPADRRFAERVKRYAGFYLNEDPGAPNYDAQHKIIRSMFNGSRGPLLRRTTGLDWAGDPIEIENRFRPGHGESSYAQMVEHFKDYNDTVGDHPQNLKATTLAFNAYVLDSRRQVSPVAVGICGCLARPNARQFVHHSHQCRTRREDWQRCGGPLVGWSLWLGFHGLRSGNEENGQPQPA